MHLLTQQVINLERDLRDVQKDICAKTIRYDSPQTLLETYQRAAIVQREITNRPDTPSLENHMPIDSTRGR